MADSSYDIHVRTRREGDAVRETTADLQQATAATNEAAAAATRLAQANQGVAQSAAARRAAEIMACHANDPEPTIRDVSSGPGPGGFINTAGELEYVSKAATEAAAAEQLTIGAINTATAAAAANAQAERARAEATQITTAAKLEEVAATEGVTAAELELYAAQAQATAATAESAAATEADMAAKIENAEASSLMDVNTRGLGAGVSRLGSQLLGLGGLGRSIFNPMILAVIVLVDLYAKAKRELEEWNRELDKEGERAASPTFRAGFEARREATTKARLELEAYTDRLKHAVDAEKEIMAVYDRQIALERERAQARKSVADAEEGVEAQRLANLHQEGVVSTEQYYVRLEEIQRRHIARQLEIEKEADAKEVELKQAQADRAAGRVGDTQKAADARRGPANAAGQKVADDEALLRTLEHDQEEKQKRLSETEKNLNDLNTLGRSKRAQQLVQAYENLSAGRGGYWDRTYWENADESERLKIKEYEVAKRDFYKGREDISKLQGKLPEERSVAAQTQRDLDRAERAAEAATTEAQKLKDELEDLKARLGIKEDASAKVAKSKTEEEATKAVGEIERSSPQAAAEVKALRGAGVAIENAASGGRPVTTEERDLITRIASLAQGKQVGYADAVKYVQDLAKSDDALLQVLKAIADRRNTLNLTPGDAGKTFRDQLGQVVSRLGQLLGPDLNAAGRGLMTTRTGNVTPRPEPKFDFDAPGHEDIKALAEQYKAHLAAQRAAIVQSHGVITAAMKEEAKRLNEELANIHKQIADLKNQ